VTAVDAVPDPAVRHLVKLMVLHPERAGEEAKSALHVSSAVP
jgi:hypothetical protein